MFHRFTVLLPDAPLRWERWSCRPASSPVLEEILEGLVPEATVSGPLVVGLPAQTCRTFAFRIPSQDPKTARLLAFAQLEKRGLATGDATHTPFECHTFPLPEGGAVLSVDVPSASAASTYAVLKPAGLLPAARCYTLPENALILKEEHGRLLLLATTRGGNLIHSHLLSADRNRPDHMATEIRITHLTLLQQGLIPEIHTMELQAALEDPTVAALAQMLGLAIHRVPKPPPDPARIGRLANQRMLPSERRTALRGRQRKQWKWAAAVAAAAGLGWWVTSQRSSLARLEKKAAELERTVNTSAGSNEAEKAISDRARATQQRWQGLRMALEPKRYPMVQLNSLTKCLGEGGIVLRRFESKGPELSITGTAESAGEAYTFYSTVSDDPELRVFAWSMVQPTLDTNGTATFHLKGKMK